MADVAHRALALSQAARLGVSRFLDLAFQLLAGRLLGGGQFRQGEAPADQMHGVHYPSGDGALQRATVAAWHRQVLGTLALVSHQ